jgi:hypothetical protein
VISATLPVKSKFAPTLMTRSCSEEITTDFTDDTDYSSFGYIDGYSETATTCQKNSAPDSKPGALTTDN